MSHVPTFISLLQAAQQLQTALASDAFDFVENTLKKGKANDAQLVDVGFLLREMENVFDECRKEAKARKELISRLLAAKAIDSLNDPEGAQGRFDGNLASAIPDAKIYPKIPRPGSDDYLALMEFMGVPAPVAALGLLKPSFTATQEWLQERAAEGKNPPNCLGTYTDAVCIFRRKKQR